MSAAAPIKGGVISSVHPNSLGDVVGIRKGDTLLSINGHTLRDVIDYRYYAADEELVLEIERRGQRLDFEVYRDYESELGLEFEEPVFDGMRRCDNRCPFCFVNQMPGGMRRSLYVHDDDYRYSFLMGNFVTLTNLSDEDWQRIGEQRLSPLYVSIHAADLQVRRRMLGNPTAPDILEQLHRLGQMGIEVHGQIVIVPGMNDGEVLRESVDELASLWPIVRSVAIVPVGLTRYHSGGLRSVRPGEASDILGMVEARVEGFRKRFGRVWLYPSDEMYLLAGQEIPDISFYDEEAQLENGVGLVRLLLDDWEDVRRSIPDGRISPSRVTWVCGELIAPFLREMAIELGTLIGVNVQVVPVVNRFFGSQVTVSGLLTGQDVLAALANREVGERVFLPRAMFQADAEITLDDLTSQDLREKLGVPTVLASTISEVIAGLTAASSERR